MNPIKIIAPIVSISILIIFAFSRISSDEIGIKKDEVVWNPGMQFSFSHIAKFHKEIELTDINTDKFYGSVKFKLPGNDSIIQQMYKSYSTEKLLKVALEIATLNILKNSKSEGEVNRQLVNGISNDNSITETEIQRLKMIVISADFKLKQPEKPVENKVEEKPQETYNGFPFTYSQWYAEIPKDDDKRRKKIILAYCIKLQLDNLISRLNVNDKVLQQVFDSKISKDFYTQGWKQKSNDSEDEDIMTMLDYNYQRLLCVINADSLCSK